jgi:hypothetical protein
MTHWGALLLLVYLALGLGTVDRRQAMTLGAGATALVVAFAMLNIVH